MQYSYLIILNTLFFYGGIFTAALIIKGVSKRMEYKTDAFHIMELLYK